MKSTEGKVRGRPPIRQKQKDTSASSENEHKTSILDFFSPPRKTDPNLNNNDKRSGSTPKRRKNPLENLQSNLSPKYIGFSTPTSTDKRRSKYRIAKLNDSDGPSSYFQSNHGLIGCVRRTTVNGRLNSPKSSPEVSSRRSDFFESPIEKLLRKNGAMKSLPNSPSHGKVQMSASTVVDDCIQKLEEVASRKKNCVVRLEQMNHGVAMVGASSHVTDEVESEFDASTAEHDIDVNNECDNLQVITIADDEEDATLEANNVVPTVSNIEHENTVAVGVKDDVLKGAEDDVVMEEQKTALNENVDDIEMEENSSNLKKEKTQSSPATTAADSEEKSDAKTAVEVDDIISIEDDESQSSVKNASAQEDETALVTGEALSTENPAEDTLTSSRSIAEESAAPNNDSEKVITYDEVVQTINIPHETEETNTILNISTEQEQEQEDDTSETFNINTQLVDTQSEQLLQANSKFSSEDMLSLKSPSTYSVDSAKGSSLDNDLNWVSIETGDLFWGQIFNFAYWPCMVCPDPEGKTITFNENGRQSQHVMIHVRFFADNGRRSWVKRDNLMSYNGLEAYKKKQNEVAQKYGKKNGKYKVFVVSKKTTLWNQAIREADLIETVPLEERLDMFFKLLEEVKINNNLERKRRQSMVRSSTSDICSMFDSNDNLYLKQPTLKRDRSPTPVSPAYSPIAPKNSEKRIKLDNNNTSRSSFMDDLDMNPDANVNETSSSTELERMQKEDIYNDTEFKKFVSAMRGFILESSKDPKLSYEFMMNVRSLWALKHITERNRLEAQSNANGLKRLSQRIRNITIQRSLPSTPVQNNEQQIALKSTGQKPRRPLNRPIDEVIDDIFQLDSKYLFRDIPKENLCKECFKAGSDVVKCSMNCQTYVHPACSANLPEEEVPQVPTPFVHITGDIDESLSNAETKDQPTVICKSCYSGEAIKCFVCKKDDPELGDMARCNSQQCSKFYHPACLKYWPQAKVTKSSGKLESLRCPAHVCHTCVSDDPKGKFLQIDKSKLTKCLKCPATYHMDSTCIPAGSQFLTPALIICPRHYKQPQDLLLNVNWCFICVAGGKLICCETCPTAVHAECLKIPVADEGYICEECETGRMPLYGEMVWAKFRNFRWWPSLILPPTEVPLNLANKPHNPSEFVIRFLGSNDHGWISRRRVYLYQEGDCCEPPKTQKQGLDHSYMKGVEEAKRIAEIIKEKKMLLNTNDKKQRVSPLPYVKIKANRAVPPIKLLVDYDNISKCECDKDSENPCGQDSGCLNRVLYNECNPKICPAGDRCQNQLFEKKLYPKLQVSYMNEKGFGLICLEPISAGTFVIEYVGEVIDDAEFRRRISQKEQERDENFYFLSLEKDYIIDAGPKGNLARFMNHSCDPNCETQKWCINGLDRIGLFAIKDIPKNSELTFNYFWDELLGNEKKMCHCGAEKCVGVIGGKNKKPAKPSPPVQQEKVAKKRRSTNTKLHPQKTKQKSKTKESKKTTKLPAKSNTNSNNNNNNTSPTVDTTEEEDKDLDQQHTSISKSSLTSETLGNNSNPESVEGVPSTTFSSS
ncbi:nuclear receptor binding SET domain protein isoform X2 [Eupeodes corollae]|uniref:nuclear receptor binding SET domain protein isoform X2 n=1 Tax=Eupeodes corollae TaxID=290404 RepID=UPI002491CBF7|nr:nuclear receptor binding SET domain protein isoform X2 [Eupeodes corollae]